MKKFPRFIHSHKKGGTGIKEFSITIKEYLRRLDYWLLGSAVGMTLLSILTLFAGADRWGSKRPLVQFLAMILGLIALFLMSLIDLEPYLKKFTVPLFFVSVAAIVFIIFVGTGASAGTWYTLEKIGLSIQPSEFVKVFFLITFSRHLERVRDEINKLKNVILLFLHGGIIAGLVTISGDLGSALVFLFMMAGMMYMAGMSLWYFAAAAVTVILVLPLLWPHLDLYQQERIIYGFNPELDPDHWGYQPLMSRSAIIAGGFRGAGFSGGTYYYLVPAAQSDMLFCVLAEKFGFLGTFSYLAFLCILFVRLLLVSRKVTKPSSSYICVGVAAMIMFQALENIGMCLALLPVIGITLPFFSYGGSSMLSMFLCLGLVQNAVTHNNKYFFERTAI